MADFVETMNAYRNMCDAFAHCEDGCPIYLKHDIRHVDDCLAEAFVSPEIVVNALDEYSQNQSQETKVEKRYPSWISVIHAVADLLGMSFEDTLNSPIPENVAKAMKIEPIVVPVSNALKSKMESKIVDIGNYRKSGIDPDSVN